MRQRTAGGLAAALTAMIAGGSFVGMTQTNGTAAQEQPSLHDPAPGTQPTPPTGQPTARTSARSERLSKLAEQIRDKQLELDGLRDLSRLEASRPETPPPATTNPSDVAPQALQVLQVVPAAATPTIVVADESDAVVASYAKFVGSWVMVEYLVPGYQAISTVAVNEKGSTAGGDGPDIPSAYTSGVLASVNGDKLVISRSLVLSDDKASWTDVVSIPTMAVVDVQTMAAPTKLTR